MERSRRTVGKANREEKRKLTGTKAAMVLGFKTKYDLSYQGGKNGESGTNP